MEIQEFAIRMLTAFVLGALIGIERQKRHKMAGIRTNSLVALGSCLFVLGSTAITGDASPTRIAAQIVSGVGFLGGGVILRDGRNVTGINTAATLWCSAAVGMLSGFGLLVESLIGSGFILFANLGLRGLVSWIDGTSHEEESK